MDELTLDGEVYVSTKRAAKITGYAKDYVGQLCREGRVAARLVGRNWYVLEDSIRAHRFGEETNASDTSGNVPPEGEFVVEGTENESQIPEEMPVTSQDTWSTSRYSAEPAPDPLPMPMLSEHEKFLSIEPAVPASSILLPEDKPEINLLEGRFPARESVPLSSKVVNDMQEAWQDWFIRTNDFKVSKEVLLEENYDDGSNSAARNYSVSRISDQETTPKNTGLETRDDAPALAESEEVPIKIEKIIESTTEIGSLPEQESQNVPLRRTRTTPMPVRSQQYPSREKISQYTEAKEGRILRERQILRKKRPNRLIQSLLVLIALTAVAVTFIGSAEGNAFLGTKFTTFKPVQFIIGENVVNK